MQNSHSLDHMSRVTATLNSSKPTIDWLHLHKKKISRLVSSRSQPHNICVITSKRYHLAECPHVPPGQVALEKNTNLVHLFKCRHPLGWVHEVVTHPSNIPDWLWRDMAWWNKANPCEILFNPFVQKKCLYPKLVMTMKSHSCVNTHHLGDFLMRV